MGQMDITWLNDLPKYKKNASESIIIHFDPSFTIVKHRLHLKFMTLVAACVWEIKLDVFIRLSDYKPCALTGRHAST